MSHSGAPLAVDLQLLQLNSDKTELIWFGSRANLARIAVQNLSLQFGSDTIIEPAAVVRDLGVLLDSELSMKQHVCKAAAACSSQPRRLRQIRRRIKKIALIIII